MFSIKKQTNKKKDSGFIEEEDFLTVRKKPLVRVPFLVWVQFSAIYCDVQLTAKAFNITQKFNV